MLPAEFEQKINGIVDSFKKQWSSRLSETIDEYEQRKNEENSRTMVQKMDAFKQAYKSVDSKKTDLAEKLVSINDNMEAILASRREQNQLVQDIIQLS